MGILIHKIHCKSAYLGAHDSINCKRRRAVRRPTFIEQITLHGLTCCLDFKDKQNVQVCVQELMAWGKMAKEIYDAECMSIDKLHLSGRFSFFFLLSSISSSFLSTSFFLPVHLLLLQTRRPLRLFFLLILNNSNITRFNLRCGPTSKAVASFLFLFSLLKVLDLELPFD